MEEAEEGGTWEKRGGVYRASGAEPRKSREREER